MLDESCIIFGISEKWKRNCFSVVLVASPPFSTNVSKYLFLPEQMRPWKWSFFLFIFFCWQWDLASGYKMSSLWKANKQKILQPMCKIAVLLSHHRCGSPSVHITNTFQPRCTTAFPLHSPFIYFLSTTVMQGTSIQKSCRTGIWLGWFLDP